MMVPFGRDLGAVRVGHVEKSHVGGARGVANMKIQVSGKWAFGRELGGGGPTLGKRKTLGGEGIQLGRDKMGNTLISGSPSPSVHVTNTHGSDCATCNFKITLQLYLLSFICPFPPFFFFVSFPLYGVVNFLFYSPLFYTEHLSWINIVS